MLPDENSSRIWASVLKIDFYQLLATHCFGKKKVEKLFFRTESFRAGKIWSHRIFHPKFIKIRLVGEKLCAIVTKKVANCQESRDLIRFLGHRKKMTAHASNPLTKAPL